MIITRVNVELSEPILRGADPLTIFGVIAFCNVIFDNNFVTDDIRVVRTNNGVHVTMPTQKIAFVRACGHKNPYDHVYCCKCGTRLTDRPWEKEDTRPGNGNRKRSKTHVDMCHPINQACREMIHSAVTTVVDAELAKMRKSLWPKKEPIHPHHG